MHLKIPVTYGTLFFFIFSFFAMGQPSANGISTSVGDTTSLTICDGQTVVFTLDLVSGGSSGYVFHRIRSGVDAVVRFNSTNNQFSTADIEDGDIFYGIRYEYDISSSPIFTDQITFTVLSLSGPFFMGGTIDQSSQFICSGFPGTNLSVTGGTTGVDYELQWQQSIDGGATFTDIVSATGETYYTGSLTRTTRFRRRVMHNGGGTCEQFSTVFVSEVSDLNPGNLDTNITTTICYDSSPGILGSGSSTVPTASRGSISYQWQQNIGGGGWSDIVGATNLTYTPGNLIQDTDFRRFAINTDGASGSDCRFSTNTIAISVDLQIIPGTSIGAQTICNGDIPSSLTLVGATSGPGIVHEWQASTDGVNYFDIGVSGPLLTFTPTSTFNPSFTTFHRARVGTVSTSCFEFSSVSTVTVLPENVSLTSSAIGGVYCRGDDIEFRATGTNSMYEFYLDTYLQARSTSPTITFTGLTGDHTITLVAVTSGGCMRRIDYELTENYVEPGRISGDQLICGTSSVQSITSVSSATVNGIPFDLIPSSTYQWQSSLDGLNWANILGASQASYMPSSSLSRSIYLRRVAVNTVSGTTCTAFSNEIYLNLVSSLNGGVAAPSNQTFCSMPSSGISPITISGATSATNISYQWEEATYPSGTFNPIPGATLASYTPSTTISMRYRRKIFSSTSSNSCFEYSSIHEIYFIDLNAGSLDPSQSMTVYIGTAPSMISSGSSGQDATSANASITYSWEQSTNGGSSWTIIPGALNSSYSPLALSQNTLFRRRATATLNGLSCSEVSNPISFTVVNSLNPGVVEGDQVICNTFFPNSLFLTGATSGTSIILEWEISEDNFNYLPISNTTRILSFTSTTTWNPVANITYYRVKVTDTATGNTGFSGVASITTTPINVMLTSDAVNNTFCTNDDVTFTASGVGSLTYEFLVDGISYQGPSTTNTYTHRNFTRTSTVTLIARLPSSCFRVSELLLQQNYVTSGVVSGSQTICNGETPDPIISVTEATAMGSSVSSITTAHYQWQSSFNGTTSWTNILNANSEDYVIGALNQTTYFRRLIINTLNGQMCMESSNVIPIIVFPVLQRGTIDQADQLICEGDSPLELTVSGGSVGVGITYQWEQATGTVTTVFSSIPLATGMNFIPPSLNQTRRYRRKTVNNLGGCIEYSDEHTVLVNDIDPGSLDINQETSICFGSQVPILSSGPLGQDASSSIGVISYQWQESSTGGSWSDIASATNVFYQPTVLTDDTYFQRVAISTISGTLCSKATNPILIQVEPMINMGLISGSQRICEGDSFADVSISNATPPIGTTYSYQWQESTDNNNFIDIPGENGLVLSGRAILNSTYYRCLVIARGIINCDNTTDSLFIEVDPPQSLISAGINLTNQTVCFSQNIQPITLQYGGSATGISIPDLTSVGLTVSHDLINKTYIISGSISSSVNIVVTTISSGGSNCPPQTLNISLDLFDPPTSPDKVFLDNKLIYDNNIQIFYPNFCFGQITSQFSVEYISPQEGSASMPNWELVSPISAGNIDPSTGLMTWSAGYTGTANFRVRGQSNCGSNIFSNWTNSFSVVINPSAFPPIPPSVIGAIEIGTTTLTGNFASGGDPVCQVNDNTPDTYYRVPSLTISGTFENSNIVWTSEVLQVGNPSIPSAGSIDPDTGVMDWNSGFWGVVNIYADPINCEGDNDPRFGNVDPLLRQTYTVNIPYGITPFVDIHLAPGSTLPSCPSETNGFNTTFYSNLSLTESLTWFINNTNAGTIDPQTGVLSWAPNFSGRVDVTAVASLDGDTLGICDIATGTILVNIQEAPLISLTSGFNSNIVETCNNDLIPPIRYELLGAIEGVNVTGLPNGVSSQLVETPQETTLDFIGTSLSSGEVYIISLPLQNYSYTTLSAGESGSYVVQQLANQINSSDPTVSASINGSLITLRGKDAGESFRVLPLTAGVNPQLTVSTVNNLPSTKTVEVSGIPNDNEGAYPFVLTSTNSNSICSSVSSTGMITIRPKSTITLISSNPDQIVCNHSPMTEMIFQIDHAQNTDVDPASGNLLMTDGLPNGVVGTYSGGQFIISGTPAVTLVESTTYNFTIRTRNNQFGCEEAIAGGSIVVLPDNDITLISQTTTQNQQVCEGDSIQRIVYQLSSYTNSNTNNFSYNLNGLPDGIGGGYDSSLRRLELFGTPNPMPAINTPTVYVYSLTVSGCSGTQTVTDTLTVYPSPKMQLISNVGTDNQVVCDDEEIEPIIYQIEGATGYDHSITPAAPWLSFLFNPSSQQAVISGIPNFTVDQETVYTYSLYPRVSPFGCSDAPVTSGTITLVPQQRLNVSSGIATLNQEICNGAAIEDIVLTFNENVLGTDVSGLPPGLLESTNYYNQQYSLSLVGPNIPSGITYEIKVNSNTYSFTTISTMTPGQLADELARLVNTNANVSASGDGSGTIMITGITLGVPFTITTWQSSSLFALFANKQIIQSHGELVISGVPITSNVSTTVYSFTISSTGVNCSSNSVQGSLEILPVPVVTLNSAAGTDNQAVCRSYSITPIEYQITGDFYGVSINGLPPGVTGSYDDVTQIFTIIGSPSVFNTVTTSYPYNINVVSNLGVCDPLSISGIITINPFERFELVSAPSTINQGVCEGMPMIPIEFEISGNVSQVNLISGVYPAGVSGNLISQNLIIDISVIGLPTASTSETFSIQINNSTPIVYQNVSTGINSVQIAKELVQLINPNPIVTASENDDGVIRLEGKVPGDYFTVTPMNGFFNQSMLQFPVEIQSNLVYVISGTPSVTLTSTVSYSFGIEAIGGLCSSASASGTISLNPNSKIVLSTPLTSAYQEVCELEPINRIEYQVSQGATAASISWLPNTPLGISWGYETTSGIFYIEGTPERVSNTTVFSYSVSTTGNSNGCLEDNLSGSLTVNKQDEINLISAQGTDNQELCGMIGSGLPFEDIVYQLSGTASNLTVTGLPAGITSTFDSVAKRLSISGIPTAVTTRTIHTYFVSSSSASCVADVVSGVISFDIFPELVLNSSPQSIDQVSDFAICDGNEIVPIVYTFDSGVSTITVTNLPSGITYTVLGNTLTISGRVDGGYSTVQVFDYSINVGSNNACLSAGVTTGRIEVIPNPTIDNIFITANDLQNISCNGANDGAILIPSESPDFDRRISGNQNSVRQIDHVVLTNDPLVSDVYSISIDGIMYSHTVIPISFGGPIQSARQTAQALIENINDATGAQEAPVIASLTGVSTIVLTAKVPGDSFSVDPVAIQTIGGGSGTITTTTIVENRSLGYSFSWTGPNGFISSDLSISNLAPGDYFFTVSVNNCRSTTSTFTITEPDAITIDTEVCNSALDVQVEGGISPYAIRLFDSNGILIETNTTNNSTEFTNLTPGSNYRIEVFDSVCDQSVQQAISLPFEFTLNQSGVTVVDDYCNDNEGNGFIELGGNAGGEAFSGGSGQFSYSWTGPSFTASSRDIYNLEPGLYTVTVTDEVLGCTDQAVFEVGSVDPIVINLDPSIDLDASGAIALACEGDDDAAIEISVNGGLGNYAYSWTRNGNVIVGANSTRIEDLGIGRYEVTVTDSPPSGIAPNLPNCQATQVIEVRGPQSLSVFVNSSTDSTTFYCPDSSSSAEFEVEIFGGTPPFTLELTAENGSIITESIPSNSPSIVRGLHPEVEGNTYQVKVIDSNACESQAASTTLNFQSIESITLRPQITQIDCSRGILGSISLELVNGQILNPELIQIQWRSANSNIYDTWANSNGVLENIEMGGSYQVIVTQGTCELFRADGIQVTDVVDQMLFINKVNVQSGGCNGDLGRIELDLQGGFPPFQIEWEQYKVVNTTTGATSTTTGSTTSALEWVTLPQYQNNAIATDLGVGTYRARITDGASPVVGVACGGPQITNPIIIGTNAFELANFRINNAESCSNSMDKAEINFTILNTLPNNNNEYTPEILLNGVDPGDDLIRIGNNNYRIVNIEVGNHTLNINTGTSSAVLGDFSNCTITHPFEILETQPIQYSGETQFEIDPCESVSEFAVVPELISGGNPFIINGSFVYDYYWEFIPESNQTPQGNQTFVGDTIFNAEPGTYNLTISDSLGCSSEIIPFVVSGSNGVVPFSVMGSIKETIGTASDTIITNNVKAVAPNCLSSTPNGQIGIEISGGLRPYTIEWYKEEINSGPDSTEATTTLIPLTYATNSTYLNNLEAGKYKFIIRSQNSECPESGIGNNNYYEEIITVPNNNELYIIEGPIIVDDDLCRGLPGRLYVKVFDNLQGQLTFYYNNEILSLAEQQPSGEGEYYLLLEKPESQADFIITNEEGCSVKEEIQISEIREPDFRFFSPSQQLEGLIMAKEEVTFENTSQVPYSYSVWHFGDGTTETTIFSGSTVSPTTHIYGISGSYFVTLRNYNNIGCYEEKTKIIVVGRGFNVLAPNVFSPNNDGINDYYRPLFSGFGKVNLRIYDNRGNILYQEEVKEEDPALLSGIQLQGWSGDNATGSPYYIYQFTGTLISDESEIERTGTFVLVR